jgi:hypothetical protein
MLLRDDRSCRVRCESASACRVFQEMGTGRAPFRGLGSRLAIESGLRETHPHAGSLFLECEEDRGVPIGPAPRHGLAHLLLAEGPQSEGDFGAVGQLEREAQVFSGELERETRLEVAAEIGGEFRVVLISQRTRGSRQIVGAHLTLAEPRQLYTKRC